MSSAHNISFDLLVLFAQVGGNHLAIALATTCRAMKRKIDERYVNHSRVNFNFIWDKKGRRKAGVLCRHLCTTLSSVRRRVPKEVTCLNIDIFGVAYRLPFIPDDVKTVTFSKFDGSWAGVRLPSTLENLEFYRSDPVVRIDSLPKGLIKLSLGETTDEPVHQLPPQLQILNLGFNFNQPILLPSTLRELEFSSDFNQLIDRWPPRLESLKFGFAYNQPTYDLPATLLTLAFSFSYDHPIENLPKGLKSLDIGSYIGPLTELPSGLETLIIGRRFNRPLQALPVHLRHLEFFEDAVFDGVLKLPPNLETLIFGQFFNQPLALPRHLKHLKFWYLSQFNQRISCLPPNLKELKFGEYFSQPLRHLKFPASLELVEFWVRTSLPPKNPLYRLLSNLYDIFFPIDHEIALTRAGFSWDTQYPWKIMCCRKH